MAVAYDFGHPSRRRLLQAIGGGLGSLGLACLLGPESAGAASVRAPHSALNAQRPHFQPRAKRVIHLFMNGGPFGPDLLDPKAAINQFAGQRPEAGELRTENQTG